MFVFLRTLDSSAVTIHGIQLQLNCFRGTEYFFWILDYEEDGEGFRFGRLEEGENLVSALLESPNMTKAIKEKSERS